MEMIEEVASLLFLFPTLKRWGNSIKNRLCGNWGPNQQEQYHSNETSVSHPDTNWSFIYISLQMSMNAQFLLRHPNVCKPLQEAKHAEPRRLQMERKGS